MSSTSVTATIAAIEHATWIVDNAYLPQRATVDEYGVVTAAEAGPRRLAVDVIEEKIRPDKRGLKRQGLTVRLFMILLLVAAGQGRVYVSDLITLALDGLPLEIQRDLGIQYRTTRNGKPQLCTLTAKQLYTLIDNLREHLDVDPAFGLTAEEEAERLALLADIQDAFLYATHVLPLTGTSVAIDESGVWSWIRGGRKPGNLPLADPTDEDANLAAEQQTKIDKAVAAAAKKNPEADPDELRTEAIEALPPTGEAEPEHLDEDDPDYVPDPDSAAQQPPASAASTAAAARGKDEAPAEAGKDEAPAEAEKDEQATTKKLGKRCWFAAWGVKTHKTGRRSSYFGYSLHALVRVPALSRGNGRASKAERYQEPNLIEEFAITRPAEDVVEPSLALVKKRLARNAPIEDLLGDRHYSYKKWQRWARPLWQLKVRPVLDLREKDHGAVDYEGALIIDGTPHCQPPENLRGLTRPAKGAPQKEFDKYGAQIAARQNYAMKRHKTPWSGNGRGPGGDGVTRFVCPAAAGTAGCPRIPGSIEIVRQNTSLPTIVPPEGLLKFCSGNPVTIEPGPHMKYHQEHYYGSREWALSWNRRTYVEGVFGNMKNYATGNIHRGYMQFTGRALVTLGITAAVVAYNLREMENWHTRASKHCPDNPLVATYARHPLHQPTNWVHGFTMLTADQRDQWERDWLAEPGGPDAPEALAAAA